MIRFLKGQLEKIVASKEVSSASLLTFLFKIAGLALSFVMLLVLTKYYNAEVYGRFSLTLVFGQFLVLIATFGLPLEVVKNVASSKADSQSIVISVFKIVLLAGVIVSIGLFLLAKPISDTLFKDSAYIPYIQALSACIIPLMSHEIMVSISKAKKNFLQHNLFFFILPQVLFLGVFFGLVSYVAQESFSFWAYGIAIVLTVMIEFGYYTSVFREKQSSQSLFQILKRSAPMMWSLLLLNLLSWTDIFMIEMFGTSQQVGVYHAAYKIASVGMLVIVSVNVVIGPVLVDLFSKNQMTQLHKTVVSATRLITWATLPIIIVLALFGKLLLNFLGAEFVVGLTTLYVLLASVAINAFSGNVDMILNMTNFQKLLRTIVLCSFVVNVLLNYILIPKYGIEGAAMASLGTQLCLNGVALYFIKKKLGFFTFI